MPAHMAVEEASASSGPGMRSGVTAQLEDDSPSKKFRGSIPPLQAKVKRASSTTLDDLQHAVEGGDAARRHAHNVQGAILEETLLGRLLKCNSDSMVAGIDEARAWLARDLEDPEHRGELRQQEISKLKQFQCFRPWTLREAMAAGHARG